MGIAVIGATGRVGREVVRLALEHGDAVIALVRDPAKARRIFGEPDGLRVRQTRLDDRGDLLDALRDVRRRSSRWGRSGSKECCNELLSTRRRR
jgi:uncharacterized protein YbjT (DUF2867 family)